jgi:hypothetical protein
MYEVEIWSTLPGVEGEIHMMSQTSLKTYEEAVKAAENITAIGMRPVIKELKAA